MILGAVASMALLSDGLFFQRGEGFKYLEVSIDTMVTKQINLKMSDSLIHAAKSYAKRFGYRNIQELAAESIREKIFMQSEYDESFLPKEIEMIDSLIGLSLKKGAVISEEALNRVLVGDGI